MIISIKLNCNTLKIKLNVMNIYFSSNKPYGNKRLKSENTQMYSFKI